MKVVFDLDGTLADTQYAALNNLFCPIKGFPHEREVKDWAGFHADCENAPPLAHTLETLHALHSAGHEVWIWTARGDDAREQTANWLMMHGVPGEIIAERLVMRTDGDRRDDWIIKAEWLLKYGRPDLIFEDRKRVVDMWRRHGLNVNHVAPGEF